MSDDTTHPKPRLPQVVRDLVPIRAWTVTTRLPSSTAIGAVLTLDNTEVPARWIFGRLVCPVTATSASDGTIMVIVRVPPGVRTGYLPKVRVSCAADGSGTRVTCRASALPDAIVIVILLSAVCLIDRSTQTIAILSTFGIIWHVSSVFMEFASGVAAVRSRIAEVLEGGIAGVNSRRHS